MNEHQYKISQEKAQEIQQKLKQLIAEKDSLHPRQFQMRQNGLQGILADIQSELQKYATLNP